MILFRPIPLWWRVGNVSLDQCKIDFKWCGIIVLLFHVATRSSFLDCRLGSENAVVKLKISGIIKNSTASEKSWKGKLTTTGKIEINPGLKWVFTFLPQSSFSLYQPIAAFSRSYVDVYMCLKNGKNLWRKFWMWCIIIKISFFFYQSKGPSTKNTALFICIFTVVYHCSVVLFRV